MMMSPAENLPYIHGFSAQEQQRLYHQARFAEALVYADIDFSSSRHILEIGSGVGAQSEILLRRFPTAHLTCIEIDKRQIAAARQYLRQAPSSRFRIIKMNAARMGFAAQSFDGAFICWVLEHMKNHGELLAQTRQVLQPGAPLYITEVMNSSFFLEPYSPAIWKYWMAFNDYQYEHNGDPFVGAKLGNLLLDAGYHDISTSIKYWHFDNRSPCERAFALAHWKDLLLSAETLLCQEGLVSADLVAQMKEEFTAAEQDPHAVFFDAFVQAQARA
jgi:ubiquinone/menaquinone biosynthesis C-methylase UbiE